jgi:hypothetical protein
MSYGIYIGNEYTESGDAYLAGYGDEPSSHWLEIFPRKNYKANDLISVGVSHTADMPGKRIEIPQINHTFRYIAVNYSYYKGVPAPITNGGLNEYGVAVRDIWSPSRVELVNMTPKDQTGLNYSDLARLILERARSAREGVELIGSLISKYGESSYGGNSHIVADANEAWVVIQFSGGQGLWAAERLSSRSIRVSRPGYIEEIPINNPNDENFLYSENLVSFSKNQGWYTSGPFNVNKILGDRKGRWAGVQWMEDAMNAIISKGMKISFEKIVWALRTSKFTGDTAGYGQIVPLNSEQLQHTRVLWHAPIGAISSTFSPVFMGQKSVPIEYSKHRYLTVGESHRFMDDRKIDDGDLDSVSFISQEIESSRSAVMECKRLLYLILQDPKRFHLEVLEIFTAREKELLKSTSDMIKIADLLTENEQDELAVSLLTYFSKNELKNGLDLVISLADSIEKRSRILVNTSDGNIKKLDQLW